jgi:hypothetical protein
VSDDVWEKARSIVDAVRRRPRLAVAVFHLLYQQLKGRYVAGAWTLVPDEGDDAWCRWPVNAATLEDARSVAGPLATVQPMPRSDSGWLATVYTPGGDTTTTPVDARHDSHGRKRAMAEADRVLRQRDYLLLSKRLEPPPTDGRPPIGDGP